MNLHHSSRGPRGLQGPGRASRHLASVGAISLLLLLTLAACSIHIGSSASAAGNGNNSITEKVQVISGQNGATLVLLPVRINGKGPFTFALDTGASTSLIDRPLVQQLNLPQNGAPRPISGVSGNELSIPVKVGDWSVGKTIRLPASTVSSANLFASQRSSGIQGLVGSDIWTQFGKITIDYNAQTLTVYKQIARASSGDSLWLAGILPAENRHGRLIGARDHPAAWRNGIACASA